MKMDLRFSCLMLLTVLLSPATGIAEGPAAGPSSPSQTLNPSARQIRFEVVSVRIHKSGPGSGPGYTDDGFVMHGTTLPALIYTAFGLPAPMLPDWAMQERYDIAAKVADADVATWKTLHPEEKRLAVQILLEDRFQMKWHRETRDMPGFALVVAKGGPKLKEAVPGEKYESSVKGLNGEPLTGVMFLSAPSVMTGQAVTMTQLASSLRGWAGKPVIDRTGLTAKYDLTLKFDFRPPPPSSPLFAGDSSVPPIALEPSGPSIFTVVQEQLGLKLEPGVTVPVESLAIDHIEKPSEN